jgi:hypothetical protein
MLTRNALFSGTGFSREGGISVDQFRADVLASSRLKPVPQENAVVCSKLACEGAGTFTTSPSQADRLREQARSHQTKNNYLNVWVFFCRSELARDKVGTTFLRG